MKLEMSLFKAFLILSTFFINQNALITRLRFEISFLFIIVRFFQYTFLNLSLAFTLIFQRKNSRFCCMSLVTSLIFYIFLKCHLSEVRTPHFRLFQEKLACKFNTVSLFNYWKRYAQSTEHGTALLGVSQHHNFSVCSSSSEWIKTKLSKVEGIVLLPLSSLRCPFKCFGTRLCYRLLLLPPLLPNLGLITEAAITATISILSRHDH